MLTPLPPSAKTHVCIRYDCGVSEAVKRALSPVDIRNVFNPFWTLRSFITNPKDRTPPPPSRTHSIAWCRKFRAEIVTSHTSSKPDADARASHGRGETQRRYQIKDGISRALLGSRHASLLITTTQWFWPERATGALGNPSSRGRLAITHLRAKRIVGPSPRSTWIFFIYEKVFSGYACI